MPQHRDTADRIVAAVREGHVESAAPVEVAPAPALHGALAAADALRPAPPPAAPDAFSIRRIIARNATPWKGLRTSQDTLHDLTQHVRAARSAPEFLAAARALPTILGSTGVYRGVRMSTIPVEEGAGVGVGAGGASGAGAGVTDLLLELDESSYSLSTGAQQTLRGQLTATADLHLHNPLGFADSLTASVGGNSGSISLGSLSELMGTGKGGASTTTADKAGVLSRAASAVAPTVSITYHKPTLAGRLMPLQLSLRSETERLDSTQGFSNQIRELEATVTDPSNKHSLSYALSLRNPIPLPHPTSTFATASSPDVVYDCNPSLKSSLTYAYARNRTTGATPVTGGVRTAFQLEVAGLGGDVSFIKAQANVLGAVSWRRYAPDTGYALPLHRAAWLAAAAGVQGGEGSQAGRGGKRGAGSAGKGGADDAAVGADGRPLRPHPGLGVLSLDAPAGGWSGFATLGGGGGGGAGGVAGGGVPTSPALSPSPSESDLTPLQRAALFLREEHGVFTAQPSAAEAAAPATRSSVRVGSPAFAPPPGEGAVAAVGGEAPVPEGEYTGWHRLAGWLSPGVTLQGEATLGAMASYGSDAGHYAGARGVDRFYLTGYRMRGYEQVGSKARRLEHGTPYGDALGGTTLAAVTARVLLPPPFPSVRLANAGMRTHAYLSVGRVGGMPATARELVDTLSASAGVGVAMPLQPGMSVEANYSFWHRAQPTDQAVSFRIQLNA